MTTDATSAAPIPADQPAGGTDVDAVPRSDARSEHRPPAGSSRRSSWSGPDGELDYEAVARWTVLREADEPVAEMFSVSYLAGGEDSEPDVDRPVTFVFNGGPGASSAYLHLGALGPRRVAFADDGTAPPPPSRLVPNEESWLGFSDLVFIDPIGTGFSRLIKPEPNGGKGSGDDKAAGGPEAEKKAKRFFAFQRDLDSIGEFIRRWLTAHDRWASPIFIAGESYGGYRVARLAKLLPEKYGVGLNGVVIISPALEFSLLMPNDYDIAAWVDLLPTMAAAAHHHGLGRALPGDAGLDEVLRAAEEFATADYVAFLTQGASMPADRRREVLRRFADLTGLHRDLAERGEGRIPIHRFVRELRAAHAEVVGLYDASMVSANPFPDRDGMTWPDPTLSGIERIFAAGANQQIRSEIGVDTDREYLLLSHEVNESWAEDGEKPWAAPPQGAVDDLRYALALNPHTRYFLCHGRFDLVTPYHSSDRLVNLMRLRESDSGRLTTRHYPGGHMFYTWADSRREFRDAMVAFYHSTTGRPAAATT
ncbi:peptidase S10 [Nostocoides sp. F2B08]|uniref:S10 family peptidase n=1 Tax=Nostocoides sp. F2B08 TaxID=2653936 RepID=UPI0012639261|nr:peptidase S10 [Tetrasphaera sp. F2B08]KAB7741958.1 peptidase S10 [Tetrasphaera sp. F2B08]